MADTYSRNQIVGVIYDAVESLGVHITEDVEQQLNALIDTIEDQLVERAIVQSELENEP
jgi:hypothetical protein